MQRITIRAIAARTQRSFFAFIPKNLTGYPAAHALARYRCFLPDLAGLAGLRRAGPGVFNSNIFASAWVIDATDDSGRGWLARRARGPRHAPLLRLAGWELAASGLTNPATKETHKRFGAKRSLR